MLFPQEFSIVPLLIETKKNSTINHTFYTMITNNIGVEFGSNFSRGTFFI